MAASLGVKGQTRKVVLEELQDSIDKVLPTLYGHTPTRGAIGAEVWSFKVLTFGHSRIFIRA